MATTWTPTTDDIEALVTFALTGDGEHTPAQAHEAFTRWQKDYEAAMRQRITHDTAISRIKARRQAHSQAAA